MTETTTNIILPAEKATPDPNNPTGWKYRRRMAFGVLIYCGGLIAYITIKSADPQLHGAVVWALVAVACAALGTYGITATVERTKGLP